MLQIRDARPGGALNDVVERFERARQYRYAHEDKWENDYRAYRTWRHGDDYPHDEDLALPVCFSVIETAVPRIMGALFPSGQPPVHLTPRGPESIDKAKGAERVISLQVARAQLFLQFLGAIRDLGIRGTAVFGTGWAYERSFTASGFPYVTHDGPFLSHKDLLDFYIDPDGVNLHGLQDRCEWVFDIQRITPDKLLEKRKQGVFHFDKQTLEDATKGAYRNPDTYGRRAELRAIENVSIPMDGENDGRLELKHYWEPNRLVTVLNDSVVIRDGENPYGLFRLPFLKVSYHHLHDNFYGIGLIEPIRAIKNELEFIANSRRELTKLGLNPPVLVRRGAGLNEGEWDDGWSPGKRIHGAIINEDWIRFLRPPDTPVSSWQEEVGLKRWIEDSVALNAPIRGQASSRATATEIQELTQAAVNRFLMVIRQIEEQVLIPMVDMWLDLNRVFWREGSQSFQISGGEQPEFTMVEPDHMWGDYDIKASGSLAQSRSVERQQFIGAMQVATQVASAAQFFSAIGIPPQEVIRVVFEKFEVPDIERLFGGQSALTPQNAAASLMGGPGQGSQMGGDPTQSRIESVLGSGGGDFGDAASMGQALAGLVGG